MRAINSRLLAACAAMAQESAADVRKFIRIALGSCDETRVWLEFAKDLDYIEAADYQGFDERYREIGRMLRGVLKRYEGK